MTRADRVATLQEAKAQLQKSWEAWKAWAKLLEELPQLPPRSTGGPAGTNYRGPRLFRSVPNSVLWCFLSVRAPAGWFRAGAFLIRWNDFRSRMVSTIRAPR
jgi:hypothetical protein